MMHRANSLEQFYNDTSNFVKSQHLALRMGDVVTNWYANFNLLRRLANYWRDSLDEVTLEETPLTSDRWSVFIESTLNKELSVTDVSAKKLIRIYKGKSEFLEAINLYNELITKLTLKNGVVWVHGSAFLLGDKTILVVGREGAGKTTWLLTALLKFGAHFLGGDMLPLEGDIGDPAVRRWRPDVKIHPYTLELLEMPISSVGQIDRLFWMMTPGSRRTMDLDAYRRIMGKSVEFFHADPSPIAVAGPHPISVVVFLRPDGPERIKRVSPNTALMFWKDVASDPKTIFPDELENWNQTHTYWTKSVVGLRADVEACRKGVERVQRLCELVPNYHIFHRAKLNNILEFLREMSI